MFEGPSLRIKRVSANGGTPADLASTRTGDGGRPWFLPDGRHFLYLGNRDEGTDVNRFSRPLYVASLDSADPIKLMDVRSGNAQYAAGYLLFLQDTTLMAQPFDVERLALAGDPFQVADGIRRAGAPPSYGFFSASETGTLVYQSGAAASGAALGWVDRTGRVLATLGDAANYMEISLSPDNQTAVVVLPNDLWTVDLGRGIRTRLTFSDGFLELSPVWSPDGGRVAFGSFRGPGTQRVSQLFVRNARGIEDEDALSSDNISKVPYDWSSDGRYLLYGAPRHSAQ